LKFSIHDIPDCVLFFFYIVLGVYTTHNSQLSDTQTISDVVLLDDPMSSSNQFLQLYPSNHQINQIIYDEKPQQHFIMDGSSDDNDVDIE
jgi:hypothetical protein